MEQGARKEIGVAWAEDPRLSINRELEAAIDNDTALFTFVLQHYSFAIGAGLVGLDEDLEAAVPVEGADLSIGAAAARDLQKVLRAEEDVGVRRQLEAEKFGERHVDAVKQALQRTHRWA